MSLRGAHPGGGVCQDPACALEHLMPGAETVRQMTAKLSDLPRPMADAIMAPLALPAPLQRHAERLKATEDLLPSRIFYDCEFLEDGRSLRPISIGLVGPGGDTFYAVNDELLDDGPNGGLHKAVLKHQFVMREVVPKLPLRKHADGSTLYSVGGGNERRPYFRLDPEDGDVLPLRLIRAKVRDFILSWAEPELWAWYGAFDHVMLAWLFGPMIKLPKGVPMWTNDIRTLALLAGPQASEGAPVQDPEEAHHALNDARHDEALYDYYAPLVDAGRLLR